MKYCQDCGKYFVKGKWTKLENEPLSEEDKEKTGAKINGILVGICDKCKRNNPTYFQGTLQLRAGKEELDFVKKKVDERDDVFITKTKKVEGGWDLNFSNQRALKSVGLMLKRVFDGELKITSKIFTEDRQTSKKVYRLTVYYKQKKYKVGQIFEHKGEKVRIKSVGKLISGIDIKTGKKVSWKRD